MCYTLRRPYLHANFVLRVVHLYPYSHADHWAERAEYHEKAQCLQAYAPISTKLQVLCLPLHSATSKCHYDQPGHFELKDLTLDYEIKSKFTSHQGMKRPGIAWADEGAPSAVTLYVREVKHCACNYSQEGLNNKDSRLWSVATRIPHPMRGAITNLKKFWSLKTLTGALCLPVAHCYIPWEVGCFSLQNGQGHRLLPTQAPLGQPSRIRWGALYGTFPDFLEAPPSRSRAVPRPGTLRSASAICDEPLAPAVSCIIVTANITPLEGQVFPFDSAVKVILLADRDPRHSVFLTVAFSLWRSKTCFNETLNSHREQSQRQNYGNLQKVQKQNEIYTVIRLVIALGKAFPRILSRPARLSTTDPTQKLEASIEGLASRVADAPSPLPKGIPDNPQARPLHDLRRIVPYGKREGAERDWEQGSCENQGTLHVSLCTRLDSTCIRQSGYGHSLLIHVEARLPFHGAQWGSIPGIFPPGPHAATCESWAATSHDVIAPNQQQTLFFSWPFAMPRETSQRAEGFTVRVLASVNINFEQKKACSGLPRKEKPWGPRLMLLSDLARLLIQTTAHYRPGTSDCWYSSRRWTVSMRNKRRVFSLVIAEWAAGTLDNHVLRNEAHSEALPDSSPRFIIAISVSILVGLPSQAEQPRQPVNWGVPIRATRLFQLLEAASGRQLVAIGPDVELDEMQHAAKALSPYGLDFQTSVKATDAGVGGGLWTQTPRRLEKFEKKSIPSELSNYVPVSSNASIQRAASHSRLSLSHTHALTNAHPPTLITPTFTPSPTSQLPPGSLTTSISRDSIRSWEAPSKISVVGVASYQGTQMFRGLAMNHEPDPKCANDFGGARGAKHIGGACCGLVQFPTNSTSILTFQPGGPWWEFDFRIPDDKHSYLYSKPWSSRRFALLISLQFICLDGEITVITCCLQSLVALEAVNKAELKHQ
ncbi:uncharacterized protein CLUP02_10775 [Colletotrichum lupini]|uniref:Uncharacterized protein n=1 Tax=Colletotrichum lupini TaxID=145971 RepID=A0A9Q8SXY6_9PEZI|nr:uncharacterized protein CLUP02_10775 [Colletotrichum lupini]UQC85278.1 hypothetical protein CLUP02_10775 [Colletotrichum lupini]